MPLRIFKYLSLCTFAIIIYSCSKDSTTNFNKLSFGTSVNSQDSTLAGDSYTFTYSPNLDVYWRIYSYNELSQTKIKIQIERYDSVTTLFHLVKMYMNTIEFSGHLAISDFGVDSLKIGFYRITPFRRDNNTYFISKFLTIK